MASDESKYIVSEFECKATQTFRVEIQVLKSEYRDKNVIGKFYAYIEEYDENGNRGDRWNTEDYESIEKLKKGIKRNERISLGNQILKCIIYGKDKKMNDTEQKELKKFFNKVHQFLEEKADKLYYFKDRWADEKEYEDFNDYTKAITDLANKSGLTPCKITKSFTISFKFNNIYSVAIHLKANGEAYTQIEH